MDGDPTERERESNVNSGEISPSVLQSPPSAPYSPPPLQQSHYAPPTMLYPQAPMAYPPPANPRHTGRLLLIIGLIVLLIVAALGAGVVFVNASLTATYSPEKAVSDYLDAQKRGDAAFMFSNANYLKGDGSYSQYFDDSEVAVMAGYVENIDLRDIKVSTAVPIDSTSANVNVTMNWHGHSVQRAYTVHKDLSRVHYNFYNSWRIDIPSASIHFTLPEQPGVISVDGLPVPTGAVGDLQVIQGFHKVTMNGTDLYARASADADSITGNPDVVFSNTISATAIAAAKAAVKRAFLNCNASSSRGCLNHLYYSEGDPNYNYFLINLPGYPQVQYNNFKWTLTRDQTIGMKLVVQPDGGKVLASGACYYTLTVDGSRKYNFKGTWRGMLIMSGGTFGYDFDYIACVSKKA